MTSTGPVASEPSASGATGARPVYATVVTAVGPLVPDFVEHGILVFFGASAPNELRDFAVLHEPTITEDGPRPGDVLAIGDVTLPVLSVGDVVTANLLNLGHLNVKADGRTEPNLPGDVCVPTGPLPPVAVGTPMRILRPGVTRPN